MREVTFILRGAPAKSQVMVVVRTLVDYFQHDISPALCERVGDAHVLTWILPDDGTWTYGFVVRDAIPGNIGEVQDAWRSLYADAIADPTARDKMPNPGGGAELSVFRGAGWRGRSEWTQVRESTAIERTVGEGGGGARLPWIDLEVAGYRARLLPDRSGGCESAPNRVLLVLFDGDAWDHLGIAEALDVRAATHLQSPHVLLLEAVDDQARNRDLPTPERIGRVVDGAICAAAAHLPHPPTAAKTVVAGQSYGGLAAAGLLIHRPDLASSAVIQSASFWFTPGVPQERGGGGVGRLLGALQSQSPSLADVHKRRAVVQVGSDEGGLVASSRAFTAAARRAGISVAHREYRGGHDYAWWPHGLFDALDLMFLS